MADSPTYEELERRIKKLEEIESNRRVNEEMLPVEMFDSIDEVLYVADPSTYEILYVNKTTQKTFGKELVGGICYREFQGFDAPCEFCTNDVIIKQKPKPYRWEYYNPKLRRHYTIVDRIIKWPDSREVRFELAVDITDSKQAEELLRENQERFSAMFEHMSSGVAIYKPINGGEDFIFTAFNSAAEKITKITRDNAIGNRLLDLFPNMDKSDLFGSLQNVYKTGVPEKIPPFYYEDKTRKGWRENLIYSLPTGEIVALFDDVTEQMETIEALKKSEVKYRNILESMRDSAFITNSDYRVEYMNSEMNRRVGRDLTGECCYQALYNISEICPWCVAQKVFKGETVEYELRNPANNRHYSVSNSPMHNTDGTISKLSMFRDITEAKALEMQLRQAQKMDSVGRLAGGVAHDFNNMLSIILGNTEMIIEDEEKISPFYENLLEIKNAAERSSNLVRQLLAFARKQNVSPEILDINQIIEGICKMLKRLIGENIELVWHLSNDLWFTKIDPSQVEQILANLSVNARDAICEVGRVEVKTQNAVLDEDYCRDYNGAFPGEYACILFSDNGQGMDRDTLDHLFEPFFTTKDVGEGTGLGMATVYGIMKQNKGYVDVYSEPGKGTTFKLFFPRYDQKSVLHPIQTPHQKQAGQGEIVLLVEDETAILRMTKMMLERSGYRVIPFSSPTEAIELSRSFSNKIDLLITDIVMPKMSGKDLAQNLMKNHPDIKCLFMSGYTADIISRHGILEKDIHFINKPFSKQDLSNKLREILDEG